MYHMTHEPVLPATGERCRVRGRSAPSQFGGALAANVINRPSESGFEPTSTRGTDGSPPFNSRRAVAADRPASPRWQRPANAHERRQPGCGSCVACSRISAGAGAACWRRACRCAARFCCDDRDRHERHVPGRRYEDLPVRAVQPAQKARAYTVRWRRLGRGDRERRNNLSCHAVAQRLGCRDRRYCKRHRLCPPVEPGGGPARRYELGQPARSWPGGAGNSGSADAS